MDKRILSLGTAITACAHRSECPGVSRGALTNDPAAGIPPRGLFIRPHSATLEEIEVVILGLNPGQADDAEIRVLREAARKDVEHLFDVVHSNTLAEMPRWKYWQKMHEFLRQLDLCPRSTVILAAELVYCECAPVEEGARKNHPGRDTIDLCTRVHLNEALKDVPSTARVICVGGDARDWLRESQWNDKFRWGWVEHVTGAWGAPFEKMFGPDAKLKPDVVQAWKETVAGVRKGVCLSRAAAG